jgi:hypothetical protein
MESTVKLTREQVIWLIFASASGNIVYNFTWVVAIKFKILEKSKSI